MKLAFPAIVLGALTATAGAQPATKPGAAGTKVAPATAALPAVGDTLSVMGSPTWPKRDWLYDVPSEKDAAGKVTIHWFCSTKVKTCTDDLARIVTIKENGRAYIVAHINGSKTDAKKLDPIRESEGVGQGSVAYGAGVKKMMAQMKITGPTSIVVDVDGKVALVTNSAAPADLDARDKKVADLIAAIKTYHLTVGDTPKDVKPGDKFTLSMSIKLAPWLVYSTKSTQAVFKATVPPDFKCDNKELRGDQLKVDGTTMTASITCTAPKGIYEARGELTWGYETPGSAAGIGTEGAKWKFEVKP